DGFPNTYEYPGVLAEVRAVAAAGATAAIVTNKRHAGATAMARRFGWNGVFAGGVWSGDMFPGRKLAKTELLAVVMQRLGAAPGESVMVGDTASDFEAARANGVFSVGVEWGYGRPDELAEADVTVSAPCELRAAVR
ncbi:MAG: HAD family hydrolase, partial [Kiritimatiellae bacterium]|nr:HAD family hydrolase [Kiritimatiellia bacterium]